MASNQPEWDTEGIYPTYLEAVDFSDTLPPAPGAEVTETRTLQTNFETQLEQVIFQTVKAMSEELVSVKRELAASQKRSAVMLSDLRGCQSWGAKVHGEVIVRDVQYYGIQRDLVKTQQRVDVAEQRADMAESKIISMEKEFEAERQLAVDRDRRVNELASLFEEMKLQLGR